MDLAILTMNIFDPVMKESIDLTQQILCTNKHLVQDFDVIVLMIGGGATADESYGDSDDDCNDDGDSGSDGDNGSEGVPRPPSLSSFMIPLPFFADAATLSSKLEIETFSKSDLFRAFTSEPREMSIAGRRINAFVSQYLINITVHLH